MKREREAVWIDEEEDAINAKSGSKPVYGRPKLDPVHTTNLRATFQSVYGSQKWAEKRVQDEISDGSESEFESFLASTSAAHAIARFKRSDVKLRRRQDLNIDARITSGHIRSLTWQPLGQASIDAEPLIAFTGRADREVRICKILERGKSSNIEYSLKTTRDLTPRVIKFISPEELLITNDQKFKARVLIYNVETGTPKYFNSLGGKELFRADFVVSNANQFTVAFDGGNIATLDKRSKELSSQARLNNSCVGLGWNSEGTLLFAGDERANLYQFDARMMTKCINRVQLDTISSMSSFAANGEKLMACGSPFGTVDIVDTETWKPVTSFDKLVTAVNRVRFHPVQKTMLLASSRDKRNAVRVYECDSGRTLAGWPTENEPLGRIRETEFSDCGRFVAIGCKSGRVQLYAL